MSVSMSTELYDTKCQKKFQTRSNIIHFVQSKKARSFKFLRDCTMYEV